MDLNTLKAKVASQNTSKQVFRDQIVVYVGTEPTEHFPKVKDPKTGEKVKSDQSDGWTHTFSVMGSASKLQVVLPKKVELKWLGLYAVSGLGWSITGSNLIFIDEQGVVKHVEE